MTKQAKPPLHPKRVQRRSSDAIFARIVTADFSCPRCDWTTRLRSNEGGGKSALAIRRGESSSEPKERTWTPRLSRFHCGQCGLILYLGIVAWPCFERAGEVLGRPPADTVPDYRQALSLRRELSRLARDRRKRRDLVNALGEQEEGEAEALAWVWRRQREKRRALDDEQEAQERGRLEGEREAWRRAEEEPDEPDDPTGARKP